MAPCGVCERHTVLRHLATTSLSRIESCKHTTYSPHTMSQSAHTLANVNLSL